MHSSGCLLHFRRRVKKKALLSRVNAKWMQKIPMFTWTIIFYSALFAFGLLFAPPWWFPFSANSVSTIVSAKCKINHKKITHKRSRLQEIIKEIDCNFTFVIKSYLLRSSHEFKVWRKKRGKTKNWKKSGGILHASLPRLFIIFLYTTISLERRRWRNMTIRTSEQSIQKTISPQN